MDKEQIWRDFISYISIFCNRVAHIYSLPHFDQYKQLIQEIKNQLLKTDTLEIVLSSRDKNIEFIFKELSYVNSCFHQHLSDNTEFNMPNQLPRNEANNELFKVYEIGKIVLKSLKKIFPTLGILLECLDELYSFIKPFLV